eukprot:TRINITY_DN6059_c2_g1_i4.p3 TRINITY_DN6059_c2_g1~~TRINITY_DN6059_c2_g1_i4.p3  ORF type:complete len:109 (-),score=11.33 TRINITY_DN6059_c2_g1_i4:208-534(-)
MQQFLKRLQNQFLQIQFICGFATKDGIVVDFAGKLKEYRIGIFIDSWDRYIDEQNRILLLQHQAMQRILKQRGWIILRLSQHEWELQGQEYQLQVVKDFVARNINQYL